MQRGWGVSLVITPLEVTLLAPPPCWCHVAARSVRGLITLLFVVVCPPLVVWGNRSGATRVAVAPAPWCCPFRTALVSHRVDYFSSAHHPPASCQSVPCTRNSRLASCTSCCGTCKPTPPLPPPSPPLTPGCEQGVWSTCPSTPACGPCAPWTACTSSRARGSGPRYTPPALRSCAGGFGLG